MADFMIASTSTADLPKDFFEEHNIPFISYSFTIDNDVFEDDCLEESRNHIYKRMREGSVLNTSMINTYRYYEFFKTLMQTGKDVIFLDMSRQMSRSYVNANEAAEMIKQEYPERKLYMMDTLCISGGLGMLVEHMVRLREEGKSFNDVIRWGEENKLKIIHRFTVDNLNYLKRGGRVSNASAMVGSLLSIKPVLYVPNSGELTVACKMRGRKASLLNILERMKEDFISPEDQEVHILHADCLNDAEFMRSKILEIFPSVSKVTISSLGVVIGAHCGPGLFTVFYFGDSRHP
jgi:DegV family protein with EDD domain